MSHIAILIDLISMFRWVSLVTHAEAHCAHGKVLYVDGSKALLLFDFFYMKTFCIGTTHTEGVYTTFAPGSTFYMKVYRLQVYRSLTRGLTWLAKRLCFDDCCRLLQIYEYKLFLFPYASAYPFWWNKIVLMPLMTESSTVLNPYSSRQGWPSTLVIFAAPLRRCVSLPRCSDCQ